MSLSTLFLGATLATVAIAAPFSNNTIVLAENSRNVENSEAGGHGSHVRFFENHKWRVSTGPYALGRELTLR